MKILAAMCFGALLTAAAFLFMRDERDDDADDCGCPDEVECCQPGSQCCRCPNDNCMYYADAKNGSDNADQGGAGDEG